MMRADRLGVGDWARTLPASRSSAWEKRDEFNEASYRAFAQDLQAVRCRGPLEQGEIGCICIMRNEAARLPLFFEHHKRLGVDRFFVVDNGSTDGSDGLLLAEPSADIFYTDVRFVDACSGLYWANSLAHRYCSDRWVIRLDADELFVFDGCDRRGLSDLARWLSARKLDRVLTIMIDVYSSVEIGSENRDISQILDADCWFDSEGYEVEQKASGWLVTGGARHRLFNRGPETYPQLLSKYPFFCMTREKAIYHHHWLWPFDRATKVPLGAIIHTKLLNDIAERSAVFMQEQQHGWHSEGYRIINNHLQGNPGLAAYFEKSRRYRGPKSFIRHGLMQPIDWGK